MVLVDGQAGFDKLSPQSALTSARAELVEALPEAGGSAYGLVVSGIGLVPYVDADFRVGLGPVAIEVEVQGRAKAVQDESGILGDVDNDGQVTLFDALLVAMYLADPATVLPNGGNIALGDVNGDGVLNLTDAWLIGAYACDSSATGLPVGIGQPATVGPLVGGFDAPTKLTSMGNAGYPVWSPDGAKIAFAAKVEGDDSWHIYVMNADGSGTPTKLTRTGSNIYPAWSVYGIAFTSDRDGNWDIYVMSSEGESGGAATQVTAGAGWKTYPDWFGAELVYSSRLADDDHRIYSVHKDTRSPTEWTQSSIDRHPAFSPTDAVIAFSRADRDFLSRHTADLYVLRLDGGSAPVQLTDEGYNFEPAWSPDGTKIAFASAPDSRKTADIYVMNANGNTPPTQLTNRGSNNRPAWSPDGTKIAFASNRDGNWEIYVAAYGSGPVVAPPPVSVGGGGGGGAAGEERTFSLPGGGEMEFVWIEPGVFQMGSEGYKHEVEISTGFWLGKYEVTQGEWEAVMGGNPSYHTGDARRPVEQVSWHDVQGFIVKLNDAAGSAVYRLPTEAEWEYACRAGTTTRWSLGDEDGDDESVLGDYAWYYGNNSPSGTKAVGGKLPNRWGLYDMHGNVMEWVQDWYDGNYYNSSPRVDPPGPDTGFQRVLRGSNFANSAHLLWSASRDYDSPGNRSIYFGTRLVRTSVEVPEIEVPDSPTGTEQTFSHSLEGDKSVSLDFVWIERGVFQMGSPESERESSDCSWCDHEGPVHEVEISRGFWLGKYEVTQGEWEAVMGTTPWSGEDYVRSNPSHPAVEISWDDVQEFVDKLNAAAGSVVYRLPTEAEWEYACRAGTSTRWSFGDYASDLTDYAWYRGNACGVGECYAHAVGTKLPNPWGLYDMHGNVWEWVQDWYGEDYYNSSPRVDPPGPTTTSARRVLRGGNFDNSAQRLRSAYRTRYSQRGSRIDFGVRLLRMR